MCLSLVRVKIKNVIRLIGHTILTLPIVNIDALAQGSSASTVLVLLGRNHGYGTHAAV